VNTQSLRLAVPGRRPSRIPARTVLAALTLLLASLVLGSAPLHAQDAPAAATPAGAEAPPPAIPVDSAKCLACHDDAEMKDDAGKSLAVHEAEFKAGAHKRLECADCHTQATQVRHPKNSFGPVPVEACSSCHEDAITALAGSIHGQKKGANPNTCVACHGSVHTVLKSKDPNNSMSAVNQAQSCGTCHEPMMDAWRKSEHARALLKGGLTEAAPHCTSCHGKAHEIKAHADPASLTSDAKSPEMCGTCHQGVLNEWSQSAHGVLWKEGKPGGPVCTSCHEAHAIKQATTPEMRQKFPDECGTCHADLYNTFHDGFHGKATAVGFTAVATCSDCHTPHGNFKTSDPRSTVNAANLQQTCGNCHEKEAQNASFLTYDPHADPTKPDKNIWLHYIWLFMTALLLGVFGFFGIHALLWLQRSIVAKMRGEFPPHHGGPHVRRFSDYQIWLHVTIILSFLLLAATGLPLKFASASWAPGMMDLLGGPQVAAWLHRLAAIVTFGYFAFHIGGLLAAKFVNKDKGNYLWGYRSMTPQLKDLQDLIANVKWFLYLGPRPKLDRWAYWEKFDYLAVFWGVAMIGVSGLVLWFPGLFSTFLPGWALNAAYVIHSDEALLATGFIFLFHFFHTHLRPESFPMDPVVFTGSQPLERLKDERPIEYERLVKSGELEKLIVPPPTPQQLRRAHIFGFSMVAIGVALAIMIFIAIATGGLH
jgi:cytochrome b subunit of formate dehydrogenase